MSNDLKDNIKGLVLCGGKSTRMGTDKCNLLYHGMPQGEYLYHLLEPFCSKRFLSTRPEQNEEWMNSYPKIQDSGLFRGPFDGLLTAHLSDPEAAWLVVACDLPLLDQGALKRLLDGRQADHVATTLATRANGLPEPLVALWEPWGLAKAITYLADAESSCPRKFLIGHEAALVTVPDDLVLMNANSPEERSKAHAYINQ